VSIKVLATPTLPGPVVDLRPITVDDAPAMLRSLGDTESTRLTGTTSRSRDRETRPMSVRSS